MQRSDGIDWFRIYWLAILCLSAVILALIMVLTLLMPTDTTFQMVLEGGVVEESSVYAYLACVAVILLSGSRQGLRETLVLCVPPLVLAMRELDFHVRFTTMGIFKTRYYLSPDVPVFEKLIVVVCVVALVWASVDFVRLFAGRFVYRIRTLHPGAVCIVIAIALLAASKAIDGADRKAVQLGIDISMQTIVFFHTLEEVLELAGPLFMTLAAFTRFHAALNVQQSPYARPS